MSRRSVTRRKAIRYGGVGTAGLIAGCTGGGGGEGSSTEGNGASNTTSESGSGNQFSGETLTVNGYGGDWSDLFREVIADPFEEETGATVNLDTSGSASEAYSKIKASNGDPGFGVSVLTGGEILLGKEDGTLAEIPEEYENIHGIVENYGDITLPYGVVHGVQFLSLFTHQEKNEGPADSWEALWNEGNAGHTILIHPSNLAGVFLVIQAARMEGGGIDNMDPGFQKTAQLCPDQILTTIQSSSEIFNYTSSEEVWATPFWSGRSLISIKDRGEPYNMAVPTEGAPHLVNCLAVPSQAENKELAFAFLDHWVSPEVNAEWAMGYNVGPSHPGAVENLTSEYKELVPNPEMPNFDKLYYPSPQKIGEEREAWTERWVREIGSKC
ncbi:extracellular solute-binding protein [Halorubrum sp. F4]|uniref:extracellular solute-binding protein n=1 Tax=Halorubrum sp. F4 TaxID=2989715 RepID=UPI0024817000|nr:extracellular solute-binding protein [Halorubrum sp. F4]